MAAPDALPTAPFVTHDCGRSRRHAVLPRVPIAGEVADARCAAPPAVERAWLGRSPPVEQGSAFEQVTLRELEILRMVALGRSNDAIARELVVSRATVKSHLAHAYDKLGVQSRTEAVAVARERGLLPS